MNKLPSICFPEFEAIQYWIRSLLIYRQLCQFYVKIRESKKKKPKKHESIKNNKHKESSEGPTHDFWMHESNSSIYLQDLS